MPDRIAIVPAYNEEESVPRVIEEIRAFDASFDVVVVDDGSADGTAAAAARAGAHVVRLPFNLGIGGAVQTGFRYAHENGFELAVRVDGDGQHDPAAARRPARPGACRTRPTSSVGSRFAGDSDGYQSSVTRRMGIHDPGEDRLAASSAAASPTRPPASRR